MTSKSHTKQWLGWLCHKSK